ncbi:MAG: hypothetical protein ABIQ40_18435 [Bacteroidia bacterium]
MNKSDVTFELVKVLTQNEKRYFRVFSNTRGNDKNYVRVFDALDKMTTYDSKILNKKLAAYKINISYEKNYLYKQLLKMLRAFYTESSAVMELQDTLKTIEILYRKRLTAQCQKLVDNGIGIAKKYELWNFHLELIEWQYRIYGRTGNYRKLSVYEAEGFSDKQRLTELIFAYAVIQKEIYSIVIISQGQGEYTTKETRAEIKNKMKSQLLLLKKYQNSFRITDLLYSTLYLSAYFSGDMKGGYSYALKNYRLYEQHEHFKTESAFKFFVTISNLTNRCISLKKFDEGLIYISEIKSFVKKLSSFASQDIQQEQVSAIFGYESRILLGTNCYAEALKAAKEFEQIRSPKNLRKNILLTDNVKLARVYFVNRLFRESLHLLSPVLNVNNEGVKLDFFIYSHLLRLCIHFELGNYDLLIHLAQTAQRFFQKQNIEDDFAFAFIELMKQVSRSDTVKKRKQIFTLNASPLKKLAKEPFEQYFELSEWVENKVK